MSFLVIPITALIASILTFFSGFGLGTILLPVFTIYYDAPIAVALTAIVHFTNNIFKLGFDFLNENVIEEHALQLKADRVILVHGTSNLF